MRPRGGPPPSHMNRRPGLRTALPALAALALGALALGAHSARAAAVRASGTPVPIEPALVGYNVSIWRDGPGWDEPGFASSVAALSPGTLRYPAGTASNYWDWRTGTVIESIRSGSFRFVEGRERQRPADLLAALPDGTDVVYVVNLARPTPVTGVPLDADAATLRSEAALGAKIDDMLEAIDAFGDRLSHVELGNEFYPDARGAPTSQGGVYADDVALYLAHADRVARAVRGRARERGRELRIAVLGQASRGGVFPDWNRALYEAIGTGALAEIDAVTFHWYSGPGDLDALGDAPEAARAEASLAQAWRHAEAGPAEDLARLPDGLDAWITEYNTWSDPDGTPPGGPIAGSWTNALFTATQTLRFAALDPRVALLNVHSIAGGANVQWNMLDTPARLSGNGVAMAALARAFRGRTELRELAFDDLAVPPVDAGTPAVHGVRLAGGGGEALAIVNASRRAVPGVDLAGALFRGGAYRLERHHDRSPLDAPVRAGADGGIESSEGPWDGSPVTLPPFSLTVLRSTDG